MKSKKVFEILMLLVNSGLSRRDIYDGLTALSNMNEKERRNIVEELSYIVSDARKDVERLLRRGDVYYSNEISSRRLFDDDSLAEDAVYRVNDLLRREANLSVQDAAKILTQRIRVTYPNANIPPLSKRSFVEWLLRVSDVVQPRDLISISTKIRNEIVHSVGSKDWSLRDK